MFSAQGRYLGTGGCGEGDMRRRRSRASRSLIAGHVHLQSPRGSAAGGLRRHASCCTRCEHIRDPACAEPGGASVPSRHGVRPGSREASTQVKVSTGMSVCDHSHCRAGNVSFGPPVTYRKRRRSTSASDWRSTASRRAEADRKQLQPSEWDPGSKIGEGRERRYFARLPSSDSMANYQFELGSRVLSKLKRGRRPLLPPSAVTRGRDGNVHVSKACRTFRNTFVWGISIFGHV
jgi:hypothetical protein